MTMFDDALHDYDVILPHKKYAKHWTTPYQKVH